jgi:hypothetical protein
MTVSPNTLRKIAEFHGETGDEAARRAQLDSMAAVAAIRNPPERTFNFNTEINTGMLFWRNQYRYSLDIRVVIQEPCSVNISLKRTLNENPPTNEPISPDKVIIMKMNIADCRLSEIKNIQEIPKILEKIQPTFEVTAAGECLLHY